jgi:hypothetical protein
MCIVDVLEVALAACDPTVATSLHLWVRSGRRVESGLGRFFCYTAFEARSEATQHT